MVALVLLLGLLAAEWFLRGYHARTHNAALPPELRGETRNLTWQDIEHKVRVVCFGDSITYGEALDHSLAYPAILEHMLQAADPDADWAVINAGICGDTAVQGLSRLERDVLWYGPHAVILAFGLNDSNLGHWPLDADRERHMRGELQLWERVDTALRKSHLYLTLRGRVHRLWRVLSGPTSAAFATESLLPEPRVSPEGFEIAQSLLVQRIREHNPDTLILAATLTPVTTAFRSDQSEAWRQQQWNLHSEYTQIVRRVAHRSAAVLLDLQTAFTDAGCSGPLSSAQHNIACDALVRGDGVHLTSAGEFLIAEAAMELLLSTDPPEKVARQRR